MDWANERYVRLFVRDTTTWKMLPWQSRALLPLVLRKLDRSGVIEVGNDGEEGLAALVDVPLEFLRDGLPALLKREVFKMANGKFVMPNFLAAQEAKQSDAQRKRESRENQRIAAMRSQPVTDGHNMSESQTVTGCPPVSVLVTPDQTRTNPDPDQTEPESLPARDPGTSTTEQAPVTCTRATTTTEQLTQLALVPCSKPEAPAPRKTRPTTSDNLARCIKLAVERQPNASMWAAEPFAIKTADEFLRSIGDIEKSLPELERKIALFAADPDMQPWTVKKFCEKYNGIGLPKLEFGKAPPVATRPRCTPIRER